MSLEKGMYDLFEFLVVQWLKLLLESLVLGSYVQVVCEFGQKSRIVVFKSIFSVEVNIGFVMWAVQVNRFVDKCFKCSGVNECFENVVLFLYFNFRENSIGSVEILWCIFLFFLDVCCFFQCGFECFLVCFFYWVVIVGFFVGFKGVMVKLVFNIIVVCILVFDIGGRGFG